MHVSLMVSPLILGSSSAHPFLDLELLNLYITLHNLEENPENQVLGGMGAGPAETCLPGALKSAGGYRDYVG